MKIKKILTFLLLSFSFGTQALSPNTMFVIIGVVKYYNGNCAGLSPSGYHKMNKGLKRFKMNKTPLLVLESNPIAVSSYKVAKKFGCKGTKKEIYRAGFGQYIN